MMSLFMNLSEREEIAKSTMRGEEAKIESENSITTVAAEQISVANERGSVIREDIRAE